MQDWARNLASRFDFLADDCVIWAQLINQQPSSADEISKYLLMAMDRGLPVYSGGLRLLTDGIRLMGSSSLAASLSAEPGTPPLTDPSLHDIASRAWPEGHCETVALVVGTHFPGTRSSCPKTFRAPCLQIPDSIETRLSDIDCPQTDVS